MSEQQRMPREWWFIETDAGFFNRWNHDPKWVPAELKTHVREVLPEEPKPALSFETGYRAALEFSPAVNGLAHALDAVRSQMYVEQDRLPAGLLSLQTSVTMALAAFNQAKKDFGEK